MVSIEDNIAEKDFQEKIASSSDIKKNILEILELDNEINNFNFEREIEFINGITSDFIIYDNSKEMKAIIECKRADIGVTEYVRGVGQLFQYEYFQDEQIAPRKHFDMVYNNKFNNNILIIPSSFIRNTNLNIGKFKYPKNSMILEVHIANNRVRKITNKELKELANAIDNDLLTISQYYVRDNRLFECFIAFQLTVLLNQLNTNMGRKDIENKLLRKINVINNRNWRNAFITLSSLGFLSSRAKIIDTQLSLVQMDVCSFINLLYKDYLYPFIDLIMEVLSANATNGVVNLSNKEIGELIRNKHNGKDILYVTDSDDRYISSWLNIMRDDLGCIAFKSRKRERKINYIPKELTDQERIKKIKTNTVSLEYFQKFENIKNELIKGVL